MNLGHAHGVVQIKCLFSDCLKHGKRLCHECVHVHMCDGIAANDCDIISLTEYQSILNDQLVKLDDHFNEIDGELETKKACFVEMIRKDPRISRDDEVLSLKQKIKNFNPMNAHEIPELETGRHTKWRTIGKNILFKKMPDTFK